MNWIKFVSADTRACASQAYKDGKATARELAFKGKSAVIDCWTHSRSRLRECKIGSRLSAAAMSALPPYMLFLRQFFHNPRVTGAICPSSRFLAGTMARAALGANPISQGLIVDLGAGGGVVSRELLRMGIAPENIFPLDISEHFKPIFNKNCPSLKFHKGDARYLGSLIANEAPHLPVQAIISSLPLRSLPNELVATIMGEILQILQQSGGILIQFTYAFWLHASLTSHGFHRDYRKFVVVNLPPALVEIYSPASSN